MSDIIQLLPEAIANQISAGEVTPAPSYIVKELLENSVDAGATNIKLEVSEGGLNYVWVTDNGKGMSPTDARMAFERYATSKLRSVDDLGRLSTMGFRGEALAAIAAVTQVELQTRPEYAELGTEIRIEGSEFKSSQPCVCAQGTSIKARNIFFNVPARRRFIKTPSVEYKAIEREFKRVALVNPHIAMSLHKDGALVKELPISGLKDRILAVEGKKLLGDLIPIHYEGPICSISGFVGKPSKAIKSPSQYFFVNERFMKHPYLHKAVTLAYEGLLRPETQPNYFIYFNLSAENVDINIHPQKLEARLVDEQLIWQILSALIRETLSANATIPVIDFTQEQQVEIPAYQGRTIPVALESDAHISTGRRSFGARNKATSPNSGSTLRITKTPTTTTSISSSSYDINWSELGSMWEHGSKEQTEQRLFNLQEIDSTSSDESNLIGSELLFYRDKYIITSLKRGLAIINITRARERVLYDRFTVDLSTSQLQTRQLIVPEAIHFSDLDMQIVVELLPILEKLGFTFKALSNGEYHITAAPSVLEHEIAELIRLLVDEAHDSGLERTEDYVQDLLAKLMAESNAMVMPRLTSRTEADELLAQLFASRDPNLTPSSRLIISTLTDTELSQRLG